MALGPARSVAHIWFEKLAADRKALPGDDPGECPPQLPLRDPRNRDDLGASCGRARSGNRYVSRRHGWPIIADSRCDRSRAPVYVDYWLLAYLGASVFANRDFTELSGGEVRLTHPLTSHL